MGLKEIIDQFRAKGQDRQAVLLESRYAQDYIQALTNFSWKNRVERAVGKKAYTELCKLQKTMSPREVLRRALFVDSFHPRKMSEEQLRVELTSELTVDTLKEASIVNGRLMDALKVAEPLLYKAAKEFIGEDDELLYQVFTGGLESTAGLPEDENMLFNYYVNKLNFRIDLNEGCVSKDMPLVYFFGGGKSRGCYHLLLELLQLTENSETQQTLDEVKVLVDKAHQIRSDSEKLSAAFHRWNQFFKRTEKERTITAAKNRLFYGAQLEFVYDNFLEEEDIMSFISEYPLLAGDWSSGNEDSAEDAYSALLSSSLGLRDRFLTHYDYDLQNVINKVKGMQQIVAGGMITNPDAQKWSVLQNHFQYPNIPYSESTREELAKYVLEMEKKLDELPDISDLALPSRVRKQKVQFYSIDELPKDPLDVTVGNDSSSCIFAARKLEEMQNGIFLPIYLDLDSIRMFANYRHDKKKKKKRRMGLVLAFEMSYLGSDDDKDILACNSLELSRLGIVGGKETTRKVVDYDEQWLIAYAKRFGYHGVCMGRHKYNTSVNYSSRVGDVVQETLILSGVQRRFYSDILVWDEEKKVMKTREQSCYWLWKDW